MAKEKSYTIKTVADELGLHASDIGNTSSRVLDAIVRGLRSGAIGSLSKGEACSHGDMVRAIRLCTNLTTREAESLVNGTGRVCDAQSLLQTKMNPSGMAIDDVPLNAAPDIKRITTPDPPRNLFGGPVHKFKVGDKVFHVADMMQCEGIVVDVEVSGLKQYSVRFCVQTETPGSWPVATFHECELVSAKAPTAEATA